MKSGLLRGSLAGAAGTTALNLATYLDMAVRGRGSSQAPAQVVGESAHRAGLEIPGMGAERDNRLESLGALSGSAVGIAVGSVGGVVQRTLAKRGKKLPSWVAIPALAAAAMALSDVPLTLLGISEPTDWPAKDWAADIAPHLIFGAVTYVSIHAGDLR